MFTVLTLFFVYLANILPGIGIAFYFISSMFVMGIMMERKVLMSIVSFVIVLFAGFFIVPVKAGMLPYLFFFGHYGIAKYLIDDGSYGVVRVIIKLVYFFVGGVLIHFFDGGFIRSQLPAELPMIAIALIACAVFLLYDWLFTKVAGWYYSSVRIKLLGGRV